MRITGFVIGLVMLASPIFIVVFDIVKFSAIWHIGVAALATLVFFNLIYFAIAGFGWALMRENW